MKGSEELSGVQLHLWPLSFPRPGRLSFLQIQKGSVFSPAPLVTLFLHPELSFPSSIACRSQFRRHSPRQPSLDLATLGIPASCLFTPGSPSPLHAVSVIRQLTCLPAAPLQAPQEQDTPAWLPMACPGHSIMLGTPIQGRGSETGGERPPLGGAATSLSSSEPHQHSEG